MVFDYTLAISVLLKFFPFIFKIFYLCDILENIGLDLCESTEGDFEYLYKQINLASHIGFSNINTRNFK